MRLGRISAVTRDVSMPMISDSNRFRFSKCFSLDAVMFLETETVENSDVNHPPKPPVPEAFASSLFLRGPPDSAIPLACTSGFQMKYTAATRVRNSPRSEERRVGK